MNRELEALSRRHTCIGVVPHSELAMHMKIAGKKAISYVSDPSYGCLVTLENGETYSGLLSELVPFEDRVQS